MNLRKDHSHASNKLTSCISSGELFLDMINVYRKDSRADPRELDGEVCVRECCSRIYISLGSSPSARYSLTVSSFGFLWDSSQVYISITTFSDECLGLNTDEGRSEV